MQVSLAASMPGQWQVARVFYDKTKRNELMGVKSVMYMLQLLQRTTKNTYFYFSSKHATIYVLHRFMYNSIEINQSQPRLCTIY